jgi:hypothetical protein
MPTLNAFVDLTTNNLIGNIPGGGSGVTAPQASSAFSETLRHLGQIKRGSTFTVAVQFLTAGIITELSVGASGQLGFKAKGNHNATAFAAVATSWVKTGAGTTATYTFSVAFLNSALNALFAIGDASAADDVPFLDLIGEIKWTDANGTHETAPDFTLRVLNDVNQGNETVPTTAGGSNSPYLSSIVRLTGNTVVNGVATSLDAVPTAAIYVPTNLIFIIIGGVIGMWELVTGAADPTDPGQVAPVDYNAGTNNVHWVKVGGL